MSDEQAPAYTPALDRLCRAGCGRPAESLDPYCLVCQLNGTAPELTPAPAPAPAPHARGGRRSSAEHCPRCGAPLLVYQYRKRVRGWVVERRCPKRGTCQRRQRQRVQDDREP